MTSHAITSAELAYDTRIEAEKKHFEHIDSFSTLPPITNWWAERYVRPRMQAVFGMARQADFYALPIQQIASQKPHVEVASLGSGDGEVEIGLSKRLATLGIGNVHIVGIELSPELVARANARANDEGLAGTVQFRVADFNKGILHLKWNAIIANQVLHHVVELESVIDAIYASLEVDGVFMTRDMIGRNGHQAWPEAKELVDRIWQAMPQRYKFHQLYQRKFQEFPNFDFAKSGFEGIRAQDILPLLVERFQVARFYAFGGIVERFISRGFGGNYDQQNEDDTAFVTMLQVMNDLAIDTAYTTPTQMAACFVKYPAQEVCWGRRSARFCMRHVGAIPSGS